MKNFFFILLFSFFSIQLFAQPKEGQWVLGTDIGVFNNSISSYFESTTNLGITYVDGERIFSINLSPRIGKMLTKNWQLIGELNLSNISNKELSINGIGLGIGTKYFMKQNKFSPYLSFATGVGAQFFKSDFAMSQNNKLFSLRGGVGCMYFITESAAVDAVLQYRYLTSNSNDGFVDYQKITNFGFNFGFSIFFGGKK